jgi:AbrB family looped-hinge helix DNA binding protein
LVTVKEKFQVTIPSRVRAQLSLAVGDVLEVTVESETIVLRPKALVDRAALAWRVGRALAETIPLPEDAVWSEDKLMAVAAEEVAAVRAGRRSAKRSGWSSTATCRWPQQEAATPAVSYWCERSPLTSRSYRLRCWPNTVRWAQGRSTSPIVLHST